MTIDDDGSPERLVPSLTVVPTFESVFVAEYPAMVALAAAVSGSRRDAEDIAQDAMARLDKNWVTVSQYTKPGAWLRRVTINLAISQKRRLRSEAKALLRLGRPEPELPTAPAQDMPVWEVVASLSKMQRAVVALHFLEDRSLDEIAEILEIAPSTARVHLHRARQTLRRALEDGPTPTAHQNTARQSTDAEREDAS